MLSSIVPKLPMRSKAATKAYYIDQLGFRQLGGDYEDYLMVGKDGAEIHFFLFEGLDPQENYGQVYIRTMEIERWYEWLRDHDVAIHPAGHLTIKPWGQKEFSLLDPDHNLLTFGQGV